MPNVAVVLKAEIARIARKEVRTATQPLRSASVALKRRTAVQSRQISALEKEIRRLRSVSNQQPAAPAGKEVAAARGARITSAMIKRLRARLGISQAELGRLVGVSQIAVYMWERKGGRLQLRNATRTALVAIRTMGKREAQRQLAERTKTDKPAPTGKARKPRTARRAKK